QGKPAARFWGKACQWHRAPAPRPLPKEEAPSPSGRGRGRRLHCTSRDRRRGNAIRLRRGPDGAREPEGTAQAIGAWRRSGLLEPLLVDLEGFIGIDEHVTVAVFRSSTLDTHLLMPAVHTTHRVRMYRE